MTTTTVFVLIVSDRVESIIHFHGRLISEELPLLCQFWMARKVTLSKFKMYVLKLWESFRLFAAMTRVKLIYLSPKSWSQMRHFILFLSYEAFYLILFYEAFLFPPVSMAEYDKNFQI